MTLRTIVVIEDDTLQRVDTVEMLAAAGLHVAGFADGDSALDYIRQNRDDVAGVFTDIGLATDTDGLEVSRLVTEAFPGTAVVVTSGRFADRSVGLDDGVRYLARP